MGVPGDPQGARARQRVRLPRLRRGLREVLPRLGQAFHARRRDAGLSIAELYVQRRDHEALYRLAESLIELDEWCQRGASATTASSRA